MIEVRQATARDVEAIREIFLACYGREYPYDHFYDPEQLTRMVYSDNQLLLVAADSSTGRLLGTASVILEIGALTDLVGEFGRLAVHPDARHGGIGKLLMQERLSRVRPRLHVGLVDARISHPYSWRIADAHGFVPVGLLPLKMRLAGRESLCLMAQHFGDALSLRRNHPRVIPEAHAVADLALAHCGLRSDVIVDEASGAYRSSDDLELEEMATDGYSTLMRIERGRVRHREIFGPMRLHYGLFKLQARRSHYLLARRAGRIVGAVGWSEDPVDQAVRIFELIALDDTVVRPLLVHLEATCRAEGRVALLEVDVSAHAPRMQRTLLELGFLPAAYIPAMVFADVERLDVVRMIRLYDPPIFAFAPRGPRAQAVADAVLPAFRQQQMLPEIEQAVSNLALFEGLDAEQVRRLASVCRLQRFAAGAPVIEEGQHDAALFIVLDGQVDIRRADAASHVGSVRTGECLGEMSLLTGHGHSASGVARHDTTTAELGATELEALVRQRPDIGVVVYRNLARGIGDKLVRADVPRTGPPLAL
jgi:GNAT superfamily N-acetyltransferase